MRCLAFLFCVHTAHALATPSVRIRDTWNLLVLGDLHMEDDMTSHYQARQDCKNACQKLSLMSPSSMSVKETIDSLQNTRAGDLSSDQLELLWKYKQQGDWLNTFMVSLGDLGRKDIRHEPGDAGTVLSFQMAKEFLDGFQMPYNLVTGNHDLEGLDEFASDEENLKAWMDCFHLETPYFKRYIGEKTVLMGISTVRFRDAPYSSHEVHIDDDQVQWFVQTVQEHPASEGWKILVASHAPIMGSGLRVLQNVHVTNGCAWLNHCSDNRNVFIRTIKDNPQIKLWFSGHFHLSHDYPDSISKVGSCTFVQVGVMGPASTREGSRQTRLIQGNEQRLRIYSINHHLSTPEDVNVRVDVEIDLLTDEMKWNQPVEEADRDNWFQAYVPREEDGCYLETPDGSIADAASVNSKVCWWHMADGKSSIKNRWAVAPSWL
ncbi:hypothetical protein FisN_1Lh215 [Fistulifera solaris]|uniref:Calcineurin-like phosphoesterase domain-containing protein n=1 Tax=Fistulifera solaris TaxID=1519565 RepID=A0A1Z5K4D0_FISSO|nr:hypothetical protein FisN_1Lh215 [Fistulifera solaris]|eukprot:GAX21110.1 hypothetical protein FisN_1Lh215 [Fistulifera solaris]